MFGWSSVAAADASVSNRLTSSGEASCPARIIFKANRTVALKMILAGQLASPEDVKRFETEASAAATLDHPNIVPIFEVGEHEGRHFYSMGFIDGKSLSEMLRDGPFAPKEAARIVRQVAQ